MKIITQLVILTLSLLLVNADQYCDDAIKQYQTFDDKCSLKQITVTNCCDVKIVSKVSGVYKQSTKTVFGTDDIYCDMTTKDGGWSVIQRNKKNSPVSFNRNWTDYEKGFGDLNTEFWYGLAAIRCLVERGHWEMRLDYQKNDNTWSYLHYSGFTIGPSKNKYYLDVADFTAEGTNWFSRYSQDGAPFSTPDNDNDRSSRQHCAASSKSGWWYNYNCNAHDINRQPPQVGGHNVLFTEMKIRPKDCITQ